MIKRIRDGLVNPKKVVDYIKDRISMIILVLLFFAIISVLPGVIRVSKYSIDYDTKQNYISEFRNDYMPFRITNNKLYCDDSSFTDNYVKETDRIIYVISMSGELTEYEKTNKIVLAFCENEVLLKVNSIEVKSWEYKDLEDLNGLDFDKLTESDTANWDKVFRTVNGIYQDYLGLFILVFSITNIFTYIGLFILVAMLFSLGSLFRIGKAVKFGSIIKMNIYYLAPFVIATLLSNLFGIGFLYLIGILVTLIYSNIGQREIWIRVYGHHTEG